MNSEFCTSYFNGVLRAPPSFITFTYSSKEHRRLDLTDLKLVILKFVDESPVFLVDELIGKELYIYDKLLYKMAAPFRRHRHFQTAKRLKNLMARCFVGDQCQLKTTRFVLREFASSIVLDSTEKINCPSKEYFRFALVNLRLLASILVQIATVCVQLCQRMIHMLDLGHFVQPHCILLGVTARFRADCSNRLKLLNEFFETFSSQGYLAKGLRLKGTEDSSPEDKVFLRIFDNLDDVNTALEHDRRVTGDNLSPEMRKQAVEFFEQLFNVRLLVQREQRQRNSDVRKLTTQVQDKQMEFRQALAVRSAPPVSMLEDIGIPVVDGKSQAEIAAPVARKGNEQKRAGKLNGLRTVKSVKRLVRRLEMKKQQHGGAVRFLKKKLVTLEQLKKDGNRTNLTQCLDKVRRKLSTLLQSQN